MSLKHRGFIQRNGDRKQKRGDLEDVTVGKFLNMRRYCKASCGIHLLMFMKMVGARMAVCVGLCSSRKI